MHQQGLLTIPVSLLRDNSIVGRLPRNPPRDSQFKFHWPASQYSQPPTACADNHEPSGRTDWSGNCKYVQLRGSTPLMRYFPLANTTYPSKVIGNCHVFHDGRSLRIQTRYPEKERVEKNTRSPPSIKQTHAGKKHINLINPKFFNKHATKKIKHQPDHTGCTKAFLQHIGHFPPHPLDLDPTKSTR